jgi:hypothetical protein
VSNKLGRVLDEAEYVRFDEERDLLIVWNGSYTINAVDAQNGNAVSCWSLGYSAKGEKPDLQTVKESIDDRIAKGDYP